MSIGRIQDQLTTSLGLDPAALSRIGLQATVRRRMKAMEITDLDAYADHVARDRAEFERLAMAVMVHETSFFRYPASFDLLVSEALRRLTAHATHTFRIHCLATSTGEEPASLVMSLLEAGVDMDRVTIEASDVSERAIDYAKRGRYRRRNVRRLPASVRERWFEPHGETYQLRAEVLDRIAYRHANVLDAVFGLGEPPYDALFCRNLMIYLVPEARERLLRRMRSMLRPGGLLFVGHAEVAAARDAGLVLAAPPEAFACRYLAQREGVAERPAVRGLDSRTPRAAPPRTPTPRPAMKRPVPPPPVADPGDVLRRAAGLADAGDLDQARRALVDGIAEGPVSADHFHLLALVESARGRDDESEAALRRALYLDPNHYPSLMQLALLAETRGDRGRARRLREKAARVKGGDDA